MQWDDASAKSVGLVSVGHTPQSDFVDVIYLLAPSLALRVQEAHKSLNSNCASTAMVDRQYQLIMPEIMYSSKLYIESMYG